jgi:hypothetical protein
MATKRCKCKDPSHQGGCNNSIRIADSGEIIKPPFDEICMFCATYHSVPVAQIVEDNAAHQLKPNDESHLVVANTSSLPSAEIFSN